MSLAFLALLRDAPQGAIGKLEPGLAVFEGGPEALYKVLVGVGGVELDNLEVAAVVLAPLGDALRRVGLARPRRPLENHLPLVLQPVNDFLQLAEAPTGDLRPTPLCWLQ